MIALDTNVLIRLFHIDEPTQSAQAQAALRRHAPIFVNEITLAEFVWVCRRTFKMTRAEIAVRLSAIVDSLEFRFERPDIVSRAASDYSRGKADFPDLLIGLGNRASGCEFTLTFDKEAIELDGFRSVDA